jgi:hypothetical protein
VHRIEARGARRAGEKHAASDTATNSIAIELSVVGIVRTGLRRCRMIVNAVRGFLRLPAGEGPQRL